MAFVQGVQPGLEGGAQGLGDELDEAAYRAVEPLLATVLELLDVGAHHGGLAALAVHGGVRLVGCGGPGIQSSDAQSQDRVPPVWYSVTRVSKKFFSFFRSIISLIHGKGLETPANCSGRPTWAQRRLAM